MAKKTRELEPGLAIQVVEQPAYIVDSFQARLMKHEATKNAVAKDILAAAPKKLQGLLHLSIHHMLTYGESMITIQVGNGRFRNKKVLDKEMKNLGKIWKGNVLIQVYPNEERQPNHYDIHLKVDPKF